MIYAVALEKVAIGVDRCGTVCAAVRNCTFMFGVDLCADEDLQTSVVVLCSRIMCWILFKGLI